MWIFHETYRKKLARNLIRRSSVTVTYRPRIDATADAPKGSPCHRVSRSATNGQHQTDVPKGRRRPRWDANVPGVPHVAAGKATAHQLRASANYRRPTTHLMPPT